ncbi:TSUP family transporter, partial [Muriicola sp.]|uniref:TSUP family transporter n=1 Tax=Muriicola sp. TaxID=2020856 RepID=UPI003569F02A
MEQWYHYPLLVVVGFVVGFINTIAGGASLISLPVLIFLGLPPSVANGTNQTFAITPNACHTIADVVVDGGSVGPVASYTFTNVTANHTISATFA